eukprot:11870154-Ditylum_brightwellii.AAC.1
MDDETFKTIKLEYDMELCSKTFIMYEHNDGLYEECALSPESFTRYIDQMIKTNQDIRVLLTMVNFKNMKLDCDTVPPKQPSTEEVVILETKDKEVLTPADKKLLM